MVTPTTPRARSRWSGGWYLVKDRWRKVEGKGPAGDDGHLEADSGAATRYAVTGTSAVYRIALEALYQSLNPLQLRRALERERLARVPGRVADR
jgi:hypothetical protein